MGAFGWLVTPIPGKLVGWIWLYNIGWMFVLGAARFTTERFAEFRTARHMKSIAVTTQPPHPAATPP